MLQELTKSGAKFVDVETKSHQILYTMLKQDEARGR